MKIDGKRKRLQNLGRDEHFKLLKRWRRNYLPKAPSICPLRNLVKFLVSRSNPKYRDDRER